MNLKKKNKLIKLSFILIALLTLQSCSIKLAYNYADWWINWQLDDYVDLTNKQQDEFDLALEQALVWHRQTELPHYITKLQELKAAVQSKNHQEFSKVNDSLSGIWQRAALYVVPRGIKLLEQLTLQQRQELVNNILLKQQEQHQNWREEAADRSDKDRLKGSIKELEGYLGELTNEQIEVISETVKLSPNTLELRIQSRELWLDLFSKYTLQGEVDVEELNNLLTTPSMYRSNEYLELQQKRRALNQQAFKKILQSLTSEQVENAKSKLDDLISDLIDLSQATQ